MQNNYKNPGILGAGPLLVVGILWAICAPLLSAANIGTSVPIIGTVTDLVYDSQRNLVYLSNQAQNRIEVYSVGGQRLLAPINIGNLPVSVAISPDNATLYVANASTTGLGTISIVDLTSQALKDDIPVNSRPDSIAVGADGSVVIIGSIGLLRLDVAARQVTPVPITPPPANPPGLGTGGTIPTPAGFRARLGATPDGRLIFGLSNNRVFVYEVSSGAVLRSRNVGGLNASIAAGPDGSRFMVGPFLFDSASMTILGNAGLSAQTLTGGSAFSLDGNTVYAQFSTQNAINPQNPRQISAATGTLGVLQLLKSSNLGQVLGLRLPDTIIGKIIVSSDSQNLFALSNSGLLVVPIGRLSSFPILTVDREAAMLSVDICNRTTPTIPIRVSNAGGGRMTFSAQVLPFGAAAPAPNPANNPPLAVSQSTGVAPANLQLAVDVRSTLTRGTTLATLQIVSPEAVNVEPAPTISINFRDVDQLGGIFPVSGTITDLAYDGTRNRVYLANNSKNQVEVFDIATQTFLPPVGVGAAPRSMALVGTSQLVVANNASENISVVDLDALQQVNLIPLGAISLNTQLPAFPNSIAASNNAILFSTIGLAASGANPGNGNLWQLSLSTGSVFPRQDAASFVIDPRTVLTSPANGTGIVFVTSSNGSNPVLHLYDPVTDAFPVTRAGPTGTFRGAVSAAADGSFYVVDQTIFTASIALLGTVAPTVTGTAIQAAASTTNAIYRVRTGSTATGADPRNWIERLSCPANTGCSANPLRPMVEAVVNTTILRGQVADLPRAMVLDSSNNNAFLLTSSGLSVVPVAIAAGGSPAFTAAQVVNGASFKAPASPGGIITIFGSNLSDQTASASSLPLPGVLSGTCVTINDVPLPLFYVSPTQINAQLPQSQTTGNVTVSIRSQNTGRTSAGVTIPVTAASPGIFTNGQNIALIFRTHGDGSLADLVTSSNKPSRDEHLVMYATGLGVTNPRVAAGAAAPVPPATTGPIQVCIGMHPYLVEFTGLAPGFVGLYQINIYVPGDRVQGDNLPVVITTGSTDCTTASTTGAPVTFIR